MTVRTLVASYLTKHVRPNLRSKKAVERRFSKNVTPIIGNIRLSDLHTRSTSISSSRMPDTSRAGIDRNGKRAQRSKGARSVEIEGILPLLVVMAGTSPCFGKREGRSRCSSKGKAPAAADFAG